MSLSILDRQITLNEIFRLFFFLFFSLLFLFLIPSSIPFHSNGKNIWFFHNCRDEHKMGKFSINLHFFVIFFLIVSFLTIFWNWYWYYLPVLLIWVENFLVSSKMYTFIHFLWKVQLTVSCFIFFFCFFKWLVFFSLIGFFSIRFNRNFYFRFPSSFCFVCFNRNLTNIPCDRYILRLLSPVL